MQARLHTHGGKSVRGVGSKFALVRKKGVGPGEEEVGGSPSFPHLLDLNARNLFSNSADMQRWQNTEQARLTAIKSGREAWLKATKEKASGRFPQEIV